MTSIKETEDDSDYFKPLCYIQNSLNPFKHSQAQLITFPFFFGSIYLSIFFQHKLPGTHTFTPPIA